MTTPDGALFESEGDDGEQLDARMYEWPSSESPPNFASYSLSGRPNFSTTAKDLGFTGNLVYREYWIPSRRLTIQLRLARTDSVAAVPGVVGGGLSDDETREKQPERLHNASASNLRMGVIRSAVIELDVDHPRYAKDKQVAATLLSVSPICVPLAWVDACEGYAQDLHLLKRKEVALVDQWVAFHERRGIRSVQQSPGNCSSFPTRVLAGGGSAGHSLTPALSTSVHRALLGVFCVPSSDLGDSLPRRLSHEVQDFIARALLDPADWGKLLELPNALSADVVDILRTVAHQQVVEKLIVPLVAPDDQRHDRWPLPLLCALVIVAERYPNQTSLRRAAVEALTNYAGWFLTDYYDRFNQSETSPVLPPGNGNGGPETAEDKCRS